MSEDQSAAAIAFVRQRAAMAVEGLACPEKATLLVLTIMANAAGEAWPSIAQIAARASIARRTAFLALDRLASLGLIVRATSPGKGTRYTLHLEGCNMCTSAAPAPVHVTAPTRAPRAPKQPVTTNRKKTSSSPLPRTVAAAAYPMPDGVDPQAWSDFLANRKRKRLANTASAHKALIDDLTRHATADWPWPRLIALAAGKGWASVRNPDREDAPHGRIVERRGAPASGIRGSRPDPALDLRRIALAEIAAEERAAANQADDCGPWLALPSDRGGGP